MSNVVGCGFGVVFFVLAALPPCRRYGDTDLLSESRERAILLAAGQYSTVLGDIVLHTLHIAK